MLLDLRVEWIGTTDMSVVASSGMAKGMVILNKVPVSLLPSR
jgi:hypothetical protein